MTTLEELLNASGRAFGSFCNVAIGQGHGTVGQTISVQLSQPLNGSTTIGGVECLTNCPPGSPLTVLQDDTGKWWAVSGNEGAIGRVQVVQNRRRRPRDTRTVKLPLLLLKKKYLRTDYVDVPPIPPYTTPLIPAQYMLVAGWQYTNTTGLPPHTFAPGAPPGWEPTNGQPLEPGAGSVRFYRQLVSPGSAASNGEGCFISRGKWTDDPPGNLVCTVDGNQFGGFFMFAKMTQLNVPPTIYYVGSELSNGVPQLYAGYAFFAFWKEGEPIPMPFPTYGDRQYYAGSGILTGCVANLYGNNTYPTFAVADRILISPEVPPRSYPGVPGRRVPAKKHELQFWVGGDRSDPVQLPIAVEPGTLRSAWITADDRSVFVDIQSAGGLKSFRIQGATVETTTERHWRSAFSRSLDSVPQPDPDACVQAYRDKPFANLFTGQLFTAGDEIPATIFTEATPFAMGRQRTQPGDRVCDLSGDRSERLRLFACDLGGISEENEEAQTVIGAAGWLVE